MKMKNPTSLSFIRQTCLATALMIGFQPAAQANSFLDQAQGDLQQLEAGKAVEREIAGGESHAYRIRLEVGQFLRLVVAQKGIDVALTLAAPDAEASKQAVEVNLTGSGRQESLSYQAAVRGDCHLTVQATGSPSLAGTYSLSTEVRAPTAEDGQRIAAERLLREATRLSRQGAAPAQQMAEKSQHALRLYGEIKDRGGEAEALALLGQAQAEQGRFDKAAEYWEQSLAIRRETKDRAGQAAVLVDLGFACRVMRRFDQAMRYLEQAMSLTREVKDRNLEGHAVYHLAWAFGGMNEPAKAVENLWKARAIWQEIGNRVDEATSLNNLGFYYARMGLLEKSIEPYEEAIAINRAIKRRSGEMATLTALGFTYANLGHYEKAVESFGRSLPIAREMKDQYGESYTLGALGYVNGLMGRYEKALDLYERSLRVSREAKNKETEARAFKGLGATHVSLKRYEEAVTFFEQALDIARAIKSRSYEGNYLNDLGEALLALKRYDKAIDCFQQALIMARERKDPGSEAYNLNDLGEAYLGLRRYEEALDHLNRALAIRREIKDRTREATTLFNLARVERERGNLVHSRALIEESLRKVESLRSEIFNPDRRVTYFASAQHFNEFYIDLLMRLHKSSPTEGYQSLALQASERGRARGLLELLSESNIDIRQGVDVALLERERSLSRQLNVKAASQMQLLSRPPNPEQAEALKREIESLDNDYQQVQAEIRSASPRYAALTQPQPLSLIEIQQQLDPDTILLEYSLGEERSFLWAITRDSITSFELPNQEQINEAATSLYKLMTARSRTQKGESPQQKHRRIRQAEAQLPEAARRLSSMALGPVAAQLANRRLVIVADQALQYIPFAMLPMPDSRSDEPLIVAHEIINLPSASAIAVQRKEMANRKPAPRMVAVIADPVFSPTDDRVKRFAANRYAQKSEPKDDEQATGDENPRLIEHLTQNSASSPSGRMKIPRLPFTKSEADRIISVAPDKFNLEAVGFKANRATVTGGEMKNYRYLHFATHGYLDSERPGFSALALSMVDEQGKPQDGFLRANEVYNLDLPAELVVLSACQTGLGKEIKGEGLIGLTRGFMYAGAARVVVSLWSVNDRATAELMAKFYEKMLKENQRPAAALRAAQVEMWRGKQWQSPYYWAAFVLQGEWK
jgi:CHAT domain-containing protein/uncharacterized protein HemY